MVSFDLFLAALHVTIIGIKSISYLLICNIFPLSFEWEFGGGWGGAWYLSSEAFSDYLCAYIIVFWLWLWVVVLSLMNILIFLKFMTEVSFLPENTIEFKNDDRSVLW